jgi:hypothetical protein
VPRFARDTDQLDLIYADIGIWDAWNSGKGRVMRQNVKMDGTVDGSPQTVFDGFAMYGGLSNPAGDGKQYLGTAQGNTGGAWMVEKTTPDTKVQLHKIQVKVKPDTNAYEVITPQCCNPSVTPSKLHPERMMYMDFGSASKYHDVIKNNQAPWYIHEIVFMGDYSGRILMHFPQPAEIPKITTTEAIARRDAGGDGGAIIGGNGNTYEFPEWSNHPYYAVVTVQTDRLWWTGGTWAGEPSTDVSRRRAEYIYLIDLKNKQMMRVMHSADTLQGRTLSYKWPWLWVEVPEGFVEEEISSIHGRQPAKHSRRSSNMSVVKFDGESVISQTDIHRVSLHNMLGREIAAYVPSAGAAKSVAMSEVFAAKPGVYFLRVQTAGNNTDVFRWIVNQK